jgi:hypothetical protein
MFTRTMEAVKTVPPPEKIGEYLDELHMHIIRYHDVLLFDNLGQWLAFSRPIWLAHLRAVAIACVVPKHRSLRLVSNPWQRVSHRIVFVVPNGSAPPSRLLLACRLWLGLCAHGARHTRGQAHTVSGRVSGRVLLRPLIGQHAATSHKLVVGSFAAMSKNQRHKGTS